MARRKHRLKWAAVPYILHALVRRLILALHLSLGAGTSLLPSHPPRRTKLIGIHYQSSASSGEIITGCQVEVTAEATKMALIGCRRRHFQEAFTIPQDLHSNVRFNDHTIFCLVYDSFPFEPVWCSNLIAVYFDSHLLAQVDLQGANLQRTKIICLHNIQQKWLLTYSLHGAESFLRR